MLLGFLLQKALRGQTRFSIPLCSHHFSRVPVCLTLPWFFKLLTLMKTFFLISWLRQMFEQHLAFNVGSRKKKRRLSFSLLYMLNCGSMSSHLKFKTISQIKMDYSESDFFESLQCACFYRPLMDATYGNQTYILVFPCSCL